MDKASPEFCIPASHHDLFSAAAELAGVDKDEYIHEAFEIGLVCAEVFIDNVISGHETLLYLEGPDQTATAYRVDFSPPEPEPAAEVTMDGFEELLRGDQEANDYHLALDNTLRDRLESLLPVLGTNMVGFIALSLDLRWQFATCQLQGNTMYVSSGETEMVEIGYQDATEH